MLTALDDDQSKRIAYENGADDYITKPFDINELIYKLTAISRRLLFEQKQVEIGDITFDPLTNLLRCQEKSFYIQPSQMKLLKQLYTKYLEETYFPKNGLAGMEGVELSEESRIQTLIARLRKNLIDIGSKTISIETLYGKGYRLNVSAPKGNGHG
jgi:DNA-binding response OmpR family regulator